MTKIKISNFKVMAVVLAIYFLMPHVSAFASLKHVKMYKEAFPDEKPKCICCHTADMPKKDDGQHDLNDYGKKVVGIKAEADAETYKQAGSNNCAG